MEPSVGISILALIAYAKIIILTRMRMYIAKMHNYLVGLTTEPLRSYLKRDIYKNRTCVDIVTPRKQQQL